MSAMPPKKRRWGPEFALTPPKPQPAPEAPVEKASSEAKVQVLLAAILPPRSP